MMKTHQGSWLSQLEIIHHSPPYHKHAYIIYMRYFMIFLIQNASQRCCLLVGKS